MDLQKDKMFEILTDEFYHKHLVEREKSNIRDRLSRQGYEFYATCPQCNNPDCPMRDDVLYSSGGSNQGKEMFTCYEQNCPSGKGGRSFFAKPERASFSEERKQAIINRMNERKIASATRQL